MFFKSSRKVVSCKGSKRKVRKLALEAVEKREMLSISNPFGLCTQLHPIVELEQPSIIASEVSQSSDVAVSFAGDGHLNLNVYDSQTVYTQAQAGRATSTGLVSQSLDVDVSFAGDGYLGLDVHDSQTAYAQTQAGRVGSTDLLSQSSNVALGFAGDGRLGLDAQDTQTVSAQTRAGQAQSRESVSQQSAVDAYFEGVGSVSLSAENSQSMFTQASFHHGRHRPADRKEYHHDHFMHIRPGPVAMPAQGTAIDSLFATGLDPADIHSGWNDNVDDPRGVLV